MTVELTWLRPRTTPTICDALMLDTYDFSMEPQLHCPVPTIVGDEDNPSTSR